jgi:PhzF family phenazine biosynthesis protein
MEEAALVGSPRTVEVGVAWHVAQLASLELLEGLEPDMGLLASIECRTGAGTSVFCEGASDPDCAVRVRSFAPGIGIPEDPVCGSGNGCVGAYRAARDRIHEPMVYRAEQGIEVNRPGRVEVRIDPAADASDDLRVRVGGEVVTVLEGELRLPS